MYHVTVRTEGGAWVVRRRYSEFRLLHMQVQALARVALAPAGAHTGAHT